MTKKINNIIKFPSNTPNEVLEESMDKLKDCIVIGWDNTKDNNYYFNCSNTDGRDVLWLLEHTKQKLLSFNNEDLEEIE